MHIIPFLIVALSVLLPQTAYAGAWTLKKGHVWSKITGLSQSTTEHYDKDGKVSEFPAQYNSRSLYLDVFYGVNDRVDIGLQLPFVSREFVDFKADMHKEMFGDETGESGLGDLRGFAKVNLVQQPFVGTLRLGFKAPIGEFRKAPEAVSVSDGQWDFDIIAQVGRSFWPLPLYTNVNLGYRLRQKNSTIDYDPNEEFIYNAEAGYSPMDKLLLALKLEGIRSSGRRITYLAPMLLVGLQQNLSFEITARMSISGRADPSVGPPPYTYFAGPTWTAGISYTGNLIDQILHQGNPPSPVE
jgi:hypothetical protein